MEIARLWGTRFDGSRGADPRVVAAYRLGTDVIAKGAVFVLTVLAARQLSPQAFGLFALGSTLGWLAGVISDAGIQLHVARSVARSPTEMAGAIFRRWWTWRLSAATVALLAVALAARLWTSDAHDWLALVLFTTTWICHSLAECVYHIFRGLGRTDLESTLAATSRVVTLAAAAVALSAVPDALGLAMATTVVALVMLQVTWRVAGRLSPRKWSEVAARPRWREFATEVAPLGAGLVLSALYLRIDVVLIEQWQGTSAVGAYNAVFRVVEALRLVPAAILAVSFSALCRAPSTSLMAGIATRLTAGALLPVGVLWVAAERLIPIVFGSSFVDAVPAFRTLLLAFPLMSLNYVLTTQLVAWDQHRAFAILCAAALAVNVWLNASLVPRWSIVGAAWATVGTEVAVTAGCLAALLRYPGPGITVSGSREGM